MAYVRKRITVTAKKIIILEEKDFLFCFHFEFKDGILCKQSKFREMSHNFENKFDIIKDGIS